MVIIDLNKKTNIINYLSSGKVHDICKDEETRITYTRCAAGDMDNAI